MKKISLSILCALLAVALLGCDISISIGGKPVVGGGNPAVTAPNAATVAPTIAPELMPMPSMPVEVEPTEPAEEETEPTEEETEPTGAQCDHQFSEATCQAPATCVLCGATTGASAEHNYAGGDCQSASSCTVCGASSGVMGDHVYNKTACTVCGAENPKYAAIAAALKKMERYPKYINSNMQLIETNAKMFQMGDSTDRVEAASKVHKRVLEIHDYLNKMYELCGDYKELEMLKEDCLIEMPIYPGSTSELRSYITKAKTYATKADRISVLYKVLCNSYGVTE